MKAAGPATTDKDTAPAEDYRSEARVTIKPGETLSLVGGGSLQLVRLVLTDEAPILSEDGRILDQPDVIATLAPQEARRRAIELLQAAERAESQSRRAPARRKQRPRAA